MRKGEWGQTRSLGTLNNSNNSSDLEQIANTTSSSGTPTSNSTSSGTPVNTTSTPSLASNESTVPPIEKKAVKAAEWFFDLLTQWGVPGWVARLALTILVLFIAWYTSKLISQMMGRRIARRFQRPSVSRTILRSIRLGIMGTGVLFIISVIYHFPISKIALSFTVFSAAVGIVLAPLVGSLISGLFILTNQPYEVGDLIEIVDTGQQGFVEDITIHYTKIFTTDNTFIVVPNGSMRDRDVINYSAEDPRTRLQLDIGVTYESDIDEARRLIEDAAREVDIVISGGPDIRIGSARYPAQPTCYIDQFGGSSVQLRLRYWIRESTPYSLLTIRSKIQENVWERLKDSNVELAYPHSHVVFDDTSGQLNVSMEDKTTRTNGEQPSQPSGNRSSQSQPSGKQPSKSQSTGTQPRIDD
jgi:small conductance mechanosensitive channel